MRIYDESGLCVFFIFFNIVHGFRYNKSAEGAISQIKDRNYTDKLTAFSGEILLVGINYDKESKKHECQIEKILK